MAFSSAFRGVFLGFSVCALGCAQVLGLEESTAQDDAGAAETGADSANVDSTPDTGTPDTAVTDTGAPDTSPPSTAAFTVYVAAPDQAKTWFCIDVLPPGGGAPSNAYGPYGSTTGQAFPSTLPLSGAVLTDMTTQHVVVVALSSLPGDCRPALMSASANRRLDISGVKPGESYAITFTGCDGVGTDGACGPTGGNLKLSLVKLDTTPPAPGKLSVQVLNLSLFDESGGPPSMKRVDAFLDSYDGAGNKVTDAKVGTGVDSLTVGARSDVSPATGPDPFLLLYADSSMTCDFKPGSPPSCAVVPVPLTTALTEAQSHTSSIGLKADQSLVIGFTNTPKGAMPPPMKGLIGSVR